MNLTMKHCWAAAATAVAFVAASVAPGYAATLGASHPATAAPSLVSATLDPTQGWSAIQGSTQNVTYCFDRSVDSSYLTADSAANYRIYGYDAGRYVAADSLAVSTNTTCVVAKFTNAPYRFATTASTASVLADAIGPFGSTAASGAPLNYAASVPLRGAVLTTGLGLTSAPNLIGVASTSDPTQRIFTFDKPVASVNAALFEAVSSSGTVTQAISAAINDAAQTQVIAQWQTATQVTGAARFDARSGAVTTAPTKRDPLGTLDTTDEVPNAWGVFGAGATTAPILTAVSDDGGGQFIFTYSVNVITLDAAKLYAIFDNGTAVAASLATHTDSQRKWVVNFHGKAALDPTAIVAFVSDSGAAIGASPAPVSKINWRTIGFTPGLTDAPDLISGTIDTTRQQATYVFDAPIDQVGAIDASKFYAHDSSGMAIGGAQYAKRDVRSVTITFPDNINAAVALDVSPAAVLGLTGQPSLPAAVTPGLANAGCTSNCSNVTPPAKPPVPAVPVKAASTSALKVTGKFKGGKKITVTDTVKVGSKAATGKVKITIGKKSKTVTLKSGKAVWKYKLPKKKQKLKITAAYRGSAAAKASTVHKTIKVKKK